MKAPIQITAPKQEENSQNCEVVLVRLKSDFPLNFKPGAMDFLKYRRNNFNEQISRSFIRVDRDIFRGWGREGGGQPRDSSRLRARPREVRHPPAPRESSPMAPRATHAAGLLARAVLRDAAVAMLLDSQVVEPRARRHGHDHLRTEQGPRRVRALAARRARHRRRAEGGRQREEPGRRRRGRGSAGGVELHGQAKTLDKEGKHLDALRECASGAARRLPSPSLPLPFSLYLGLRKTIKSMNKSLKIIY